MNIGTLATYEPSATMRMRWFVRSLPGRLKDWIVRLLLDAVVRLQARDSNLMHHARNELRILGLMDGEPMNAAMARDAMQLLAVFSAQGHSGFSASYCTSLVEKLMRFEPITPLTGADDEWIDHGYCKQNKRCSHVFMQPDRFNGQAYDGDARIFREPNGSCFTSHDSMVPITFPYTPKREYVDVPAATP